MMSEEQQPKTGMTRPLSARAALLYAAVWAPAAIMALVIKRKLLTDEGGGYDLVAEAIGRGDGSNLSAFEKVALYRWDVLLAGILIPVVWLWCLKILRPLSRGVATCLLSIATTIALFIELKVFWEVGTFLPVKTLAAGWFGAGRTYAADYLHSGSVMKLAGLLIFAIVIAVAAAWTDRRDVRTQRASFGLGKVTLALATLFVLGAFARPSLPKTPYDQSGLSLTMREFFGFGASQPGDEAASASASIATILNAYRGISRAPVPNAPSKYFGAAKDYNVVFFLYETLPYACYKHADAAAALPHFNALAQTSFVTENHFATYPYSRRAYFSIYSGWYPAHGMRDFTDELWDRGADVAAPGAPQSARAIGYRTAAFVPEVASEWESDVTRYRALGFDHHVVPPNAELWKAASRDSAEARVAWQRSRDRDALDLLMKQVTAWSDSGLRWLVAYNPQLTHGPWPGASKAGNEDAICKVGLRLFHEVDEGLGKILALLEKTGQRDRTIIVALGDHGLRTRAEYPGFHGATLDDITFHVPLMISVPAVLKEPQIIPWPTSHVDIAPSVLDLLGVVGGRGTEQGSPMWNQQLADRRIFIFAQGYLGTDGYIDPVRAVMMNYLFQGVAAAPWNGTLRFEARDVLRTGEEERASVARTMFGSVQIQQQLMKHMLNASWAAGDAAFHYRPPAPTGSTLRPVDPKGNQRPEDVRR